MLRKIFLCTLMFSVLALNLVSPIFAAEISYTDELPMIKVLCYHHIVPEPLPKKIDTTVSVSEFEEQMKYLYQHGYYTASLKDIEDFLYNKKKLPEKTVVITFDDGYESNYIYAYPILKKYGFRAVIFPIGNGITQSEQPNKNPNTLTKLSYRQIREMAESGLIEFGNHTFDAHDFTDEKPLLLTMTGEEVLADFEKVHELFHQLGLPQPKSIAYPFGKYSDIVIESAKQRGYNIGFTVKYGFVFQDSPPMALNRIIIPSNISIDEFKALLQDESLALPEGFEDSILLFLNSDTAYIMGKPTLLQAPIKFVKGTYLAPLDFIIDQLKWDLIWDPILFQVAIKPSEKTGSFFCLPAYMVDGEIMLPVNLLAKTMGYEALLLENGQGIKLKKP